METIDQQVRQVGQSSLITCVTPHSHLNSCQLQEQQLSSQLKAKLSLRHDYNRGESILICSNFLDVGQYNKSINGGNVQERRSYQILKPTWHGFSLLGLVALVYHDSH